MTEYTFRRFLRETILNQKNWRALSQCYIFRAVSEMFGCFIGGIIVAEKIVPIVGAPVALAICILTVLFGALRFIYWWWRDEHEYGWRGGR